MCCRVFIPHPANREIVSFFVVSCMPAFVRCDAKRCVLDFHCYGFEVEKISGQSVVVGGVAHSVFGILLFFVGFVCFCDLLSLPSLSSQSSLSSLSSELLQFSQS